MAIQECSKAAVRRPDSLHRCAALFLICIAWLGALKPSHAFGLPSSEPYKVSIDDTPPPIGLGRILIHVEDKTTHQPATNGTVIAKAAMPSMGMGETYHEASPVTGRPGEYELDWPFQMAGEWEIHAEFKGPKGTADASVMVSPGAFALPSWAEALLALSGFAVLGAILNAARTRNGRERLVVLFQRKNVLALLVLGALTAGAWLIVRRMKAGTVDWNQMSMQMQDYTAPSPVAVQPAKVSIISDVVTYTGSVAPFVEDTVNSRMTGRIVQTLYPGDHVTAGEVIVQLEQPDVVAKAQQARFAALGAERGISENETRLQQAQAALDAARAAAQGSQSGIREARQADIGAQGAVSQAESERAAAIEAREMAAADLAAAQDAVAQSQAGLDKVKADAAYWQQEIPREASLLAHGAVSRDEYQGELAKSQVAEAAVQEAAATLSHSRDGVAAARAKVAQAAQQIQAAQAQITQAQAAAGGQAAKVGEASAAAHGSQANVANALHGVMLARKQIISSQAMLQQARAAQAETEANMGYLTIRAPVSGVVTQRLADPGTVVGPGMGVLKIVRLDRVRLQANVSASDLARIHTGVPVTAVVQGDSTPIQARVTDVFPSASEVSRTSVVEAVVPNIDGRLLPGQFVTLQFHIAAAHSVLVVPVSAVVSMAGAMGSLAGSSGSAANGGSGVWIAQHGLAHLVPVTLGGSDGVNQQVLSGIRPGELVIVSGTEGLTEGAAISYPGMSHLTPEARPGGPEVGGYGGGSASLSGPVGLIQHVGGLTVTLAFDPSPPKVGDETLTFTVADGNGLPVKGAVVRVRSAMPSMSMSGPSGTATDRGDGTYTMPLLLGMGADWRVTAAIAIPGKPTVTAIFNFKVQ